MRVLVTGAGGFLGSHVVRALRARGHDVRAMVRPGRPRAHLEEFAEVVEGDLTEEARLRTISRDCGGLVHCGARMGYWSRRNAEQRAVNVEGTSKLLRAAHANGTARIVHVSSIATIGASKDGTVLDETHSWNPRALRIHYVTSKKEAEERAFAAAWAGMHVVVVNPSMLVGPRLDGRPPSATVTRIARGETRWVPPGGTNVVDVEDVAGACVDALTKGRSGERYILGGTNTTWSDLYAAIAAELRVRAPNRRMPMLAVRALRATTGSLDAVGLSRPPWTPEIFRSYGLYAFVDSSKARRELGYAPRSLNEVIARVCAAI